MNAISVSEHTIHGHAMQKKEPHAMKCGMLLLTKLDASNTVGYVTPVHPCLMSAHDKLIYFIYHFPMI